MKENLKEVIDRISFALQEIADNHLDLDVELGLKGDFTRLEDSVKQIVMNLNVVMNEVSQAAGQVAAGADQVADGSQSLADGAEEQEKTVEMLSHSFRMYRKRSGILRRRPEKYPYRCSRQEQKS
jgi:methyl-accepting chemotaxis protein